MIKPNVTGGELQRKWWNGSHIDVFVRGTTNMKSRFRTPVVVALVLSALMVTRPSTRASGGCADNACAASKGLDEIPANIVRVGSVVGVVNGDVHEVFYYGAVNRSPRAPAPTGTTLFAIGSITKTMTA